MNEEQATKLILALRDIKESLDYIWFFLLLIFIYMPSYSLVGWWKKDEKKDDPA